MPQLLLRAIITGFGYKLGTELGRYVIDRLGWKKKDAPAPAATDTDIPEGIPADPSVPAANQGD
ncbi:MAG: hypothetical protein JNK45_34635 [Myxococcales bacterium]|nr:hypothetical protein [Myxococcales bacterium]